MLPMSPVTPITNPLGVTMAKVDIRDTVVWAQDTTGKNYYRSVSASSKVPWTLFSGVSNQISYGQNANWMINKNNITKRCAARPCINDTDWVTIPNPSGGVLSSIAAAEL